MIQKLDHISIISSSDDAIKFYEKIGFEIHSQIDRGYDKLYYLKGYGTVIEVYVDGSHPPRVDKPEALGLRHLEFEVDNIENLIKEWGIEAEPIRECNGYRYTFIRDPDSTPIELREMICYKDE